ncbi:PqqD family protein [Thetidibacter halocola]|uniref:Peptidase M50 n=1 Tax=Thetidibacter halocola TaxID=2827239 RepID=A0A8J7W9E5_9RHOB|nr:PqqD family protein [Thetidibacter halocola]MBS0122652.1 peptidase M50 [Thetidibacter halocola]
MAESFLSTLWYRVAGLKPRLRPHVSVHRHRYRGQPWYVLHDHASGRVHRFTPGAWMLIGQFDGSRSVDEIWRALADVQDNHAPGQDDVIRLLSQLHQNDLIRYQGSPDVADLLERHERNARQIIKQNLTNPMSFRIPLWDPDAFLRRTLPAVRWLTGWAGFCLWLAVVVAGLATAAVHWPALTGNLAERVFAAQNLVISLVTYPLLKAFHELTHGYLTRARGGEVREMGIMFLVFFPVPYVDASAAAAFRSKWHRAAVSAGGIFAETFVAAVAVMVWAAAEPGFVRAIAFNLVLIGGMSTLAINGNPLLKFDGYYVLTDLVEIPNLAQRANKWWGHVVQRYLFNARTLKADPATPGEKAWFAFYAPAAWAYRMVVMVGIALLVAQRFFILGVLLAIWSVFNSVVKPIAKHLRHVVTSPSLRKVRKRAVGLTFGGIAVLALALLLVPLPLRTDTEGVIWLPEDAVVRAGSGGFIADLPVAEGAEVARGAILARLDDPPVETRVVVFAARVDEARRRLQRAEAEDRSEIAAARVQLAEAEAQWQRERERRLRQTLHAGVAGRFRPAIPISDMAGRWVGEGDIVGHVLPPRAEVARLLVPQEDIALVRERTRAVEVRLLGRMDQRHEASLARSVPQATAVLPAAALGEVAGGRFQTDPADPEGATLLSQAFLYDLALPEALADAPFGMRVLVRFDHGFEPAGWQIWRRVRQLFLRQFNA